VQLRNAVNEDVLQHRQTEKRKKSSNSERLYIYFGIVKTSDVLPASACATVDGSGQAPTCESLSSSSARIRPITCRSRHTLKQPDCHTSD
jgi:hypothetical protein